MLKARPEDSTAHVFLGTVLAGIETELPLVVEAYRHIVEVLEPLNKHHRAAHRLAVLTGEGPSATTASLTYVKEVFDDMADTFEEKLVEHLQYRVCPCLCIHVFLNKKRNNPIYRVVVLLPI